MMVALARCGRYRQGTGGRDEGSTRVAHLVVAVVGQGQRRERLAAVRRVGEGLLLAHGEGPFGHAAHPQALVGRRRHRRHAGGGEETSVRMDDGCG